MQEILTYTLFTLSLFYLVRKFILAFVKKEKNCGTGSCGCEMQELKK